MTTREKGDIVDQLVAWGCGILHLQKYTKTFQQLAKFFIVGCTNTAINWVIFAIALAALPIPDEVFRTVISSAIAFAISTIFNFWASTTWVFDTTTKKTRLRLFVEFAAFNGIAFLIFDEALLAFLVSLNWIPMVAKVLTTACGMVFNFFTRKMFLEGKRPHFGKKKSLEPHKPSQESKSSGSTKSSKSTKSRSKLGCLLIAAILSGSIVLSSAQTVFALSAGQMSFYNENGILYYDPQGGDDCVIVVGSSTGNIAPGDADSSIASPGLEAYQAAFVDQYHDIAESLSIAYGIPWETVIAQGIVESASGTSYFATTRNNFFGLGAFDSNPDNAYSYANPTEGWNGYYELISDPTNPYISHGVFQGATVTDPYAYLAAIKSAGYATDPDYIAKISGFIAAIEERSKLKGWKSSAELAAEHPEWAENAAANAAGGNGASGGSSTSFEAMSSYAQCIDGTSGAGAGNGDLNSTAIGLAYGMGDIHLEPSNAYRAAVNAVLTDAMGNFDEIGLYADCGHFVATILRYSGVDPNVPYGTTSVQMAYYESHPELYEEIPNLGNTSNLQPGDIRVSAGHTDMVVRDSSGNLILASASLRQRSGNLENYYPNSAMRIFRHK